MSDEAGISAISGLLGALVGGGLSYVGAVRAAGRASKDAIMTQSPEMIKLLLESSDPVRRAQGEALLDDLVSAVATYPDAPDDLRRAACKRGADRATSTPDIERALSRADCLSDSGEDVQFLLPRTLRRARAMTGERRTRKRVVRVTPQAVDAARARVKAYETLGITPGRNLAKLAAVTYPSQVTKVTRQPVD